jgi:hypothetical protein
LSKSVGAVVYIRKTPSKIVFSNEQPINLVGAVEEYTLSAYALLAPPTLKSEKLNEQPVKVTEFWLVALA